MIEQLKELHANKINFKHQQRFVVIDLGEPDGEDKAITLHCGHKKIYATDVVHTKYDN